TTTTTTEVLPDVVYTIETVETAPLKAGDTVEIDILAGDIPAVAMMELHIQYDSALLKATEGVVKGWLSAFNFANATIVDGSNEVVLTGMHNADLASVDGDVIATITFEVLADITEDVPVTASNASVTGRLDLAQYPVFVLDGGLTITSDVVGDVNNDGIVNMQDTLMVFDFVAGDGALSAEEIARADVVTDGVIDIKDALKLYKYASGRIATL
ncbi:MAG: hypothetical protein IJC52_05440, partial [Clostridia bacterium]|nr:hypothetical protein [Clostridia bacterium]